MTAGDEVVDALLGHRPCSRRAAASRRRRSHAPTAWLIRVAASVIEQAPVPGISFRRRDARRRSAGRAAPCARPPDIELASLVVPKIASPSAPWSSSQRQNATKRPASGSPVGGERGQNRDQNPGKRLRRHRNRSSNGHGTDGANKRRAVAAVNRRVSRIVRARARSSGFADLCRSAKRDCAVTDRFREIKRKKTTMYRRHRRPGFRGRRCVRRRRIPPPRN